MKVNIEHYNRMYNALKTIASGYQTPDQLRRNSEKDYGLGYHETLEMSYENIQQLAKDATKNVRRISTSVEILKKKNDTP
jgi:esterase/lipase